MTVTSIPMDLQYDDELGMKKWVDEMIEMRNEKIAILMIVLMLLSGCTGSDSGGGSDVQDEVDGSCLLYTSPSPRDKRQSRMPSSA